MTIESKDIAPVDAVVADPVRYPVPDPGQDHPERYADADPAYARKAYRQVVALFAAVPVLAIAFVVVYFAVPRDAYWDALGNRFHSQTLLLGLTIGLGILFIGLGLIHWSRQLMTDTPIIEQRHTAASRESDRTAFVAALNQGIAESGVGRRGLLVAGLGGALGILVVPLVVTLADLGTWPTATVRAETLERTIWAEGVAIVNDVNRVKLRPEDLEIGQLVNAQPENLWDLHGSDFQNAKAKAALIVVRMDPNSIRIPESRRSWHVNGILAYSKICTHVGCPISLWEQQTHHLLCPCHQSTFDLGNSGVVMFGPAARSLPQLPIKVDADGYLVAQSDFTVPVGPSYFERDSNNDFEEGDQ